MTETPGKYKTNPTNGMYPVTDTVKMFGIREIGKNVPVQGKMTYFPDQAETWLTPEHELVIIEIKPYNSEENNV